MSEIKTILISRTDSIGDVILTLPLAGILKKHFPNSQILFLGRTYTKDIIQLSNHVNHFINWSNLELLSFNEQIVEFNKLNIDTIIHIFPNKEVAKLAKKVGIRTRIGTSHRPFHWTTCNKLINLSRKKSNLHEAQLNTKLLSPLGINDSFTLENLIGYYGMKATATLDPSFESLLDSNRTNLILHTKSKGSAREWGLDNFQELIEILPKDKFKIFLSGTEEDGLKFRKQLLGPENVVDISGKMTLAEFIRFISSADALIAASTGPLHIAAALGKVALGIYPPIRPMHPGRWMPLGSKADFIVQEKACSDCRNGSSCHCMIELSPELVKEVLDRMIN
ncbi:MAG: glycosyl transferase family 9 [Bacteroidetes bacterium]|nr:MAG: glycosyl transferase family 9 [Bacteroidota bacterium]